MINTDNLFLSCREHPLALNLKNDKYTYKAVNLLKGEQVMWELLLQSINYYT